MKFKLEIDMDNAAFEECNGDEVSDILDDISSRIRYVKLNLKDRRNLYDINGNNVGEWIVTED